MTRLTIESRPMSPSEAAAALLTLATIATMDHPWSLDPDRTTRAWRPSQPPPKS
jgi:hypothetical protein